MLLLFSCCVWCAITYYLCERDLHCRGDRCCCNLRPDDAYVLERSHRLVYVNPELHSLLLELLLTLLITRHGTLESHYSDVEPSLNHRLNTLFLLQLHLNEPANEHVLPLLLDRVHKRSDSALVRLLRLLCRRLFDPEDYTLGQRIGGGFFGQVYQATVPFLVSRLR